MLDPESWDTPRVDKVEIFLDNAGEWRWRYVRSNGRMMADSGEGYKNKGDAVAAAEFLFKSPKLDLTFTFAEEV